MASSSCSSSVTPTPVLDEIITLSDETEIRHVMKIFFEQQIAEEKNFTKYIRDKIADVKASLRRVRTVIRKMKSKSNKDAWTDAIDCFKETKVRLELKLSRLTQLEDENFDGVKELKVHYAIMDLCEKIRVPKVMKIFLEQHIDEEEAFTKYICDNIADVKASLRRVPTTIREMESKSDKYSWTDTIDCFKETKVRLELKLSRLT
uniref:Uncharacterized protein n=1 Tax=Tanacetum cinerariifolium TaxID=118510 RepID=A0A6L2MKY6_TANCI|nr:hypothetical protein [Tanacetum cinerariifolium]